MMFPVEIWEKIFEYSDPVTLTKFRAVNTTWCSIISKHLQDSNLWYRYCSKVIPKKYWLLLLENSIYSTTLKFSQLENNGEAREFDKKNFKIWLSMYKAWIKWTDIDKLRVQIIEFCKPIPEHRQHSEYITAIAVLGELIAVGSSEGFIRLYNIRNYKVVFITDQYDAVKDIKICVQGKNSEKIVIIATSVCGKTRSWDLATEQRLIYKSGDVICSGYGYYASLASDDKLCIWDATEEKSYSVRLFITNYSVDPYKNDFNRHNILKNELKYTDMIVNNNQLCFLSDNGLYFRLDLQNIIPSGSLLSMPKYKSIGIPKNQKVVKYYLFNPYITFCVTDIGQLGISVNNHPWKMHKIFPYLEGTVTALLFHVRVLFLGLDSGDICIFYLDNESALESINFKNNSFRRVRISSQPIVSIKLTEFDCDQKVLVATKKAIYYINFS